MRVLLSTLGSRGDVQPLVALAWELKNQGQQIHLCVPPDFCNWIESLGMPVTPVGPTLRPTGKASPSATPLTPEQSRQMLEAWIAEQFEKITLAAQGCDIIVGATALQIAARSVAEKMGIPYVFAAYCPIVLPSPHHAPPPYGTLEDAPTASPADYPRLWARDAERFNGMFGAALNAQRAAAGLAPVHDVRGHIFTDRPWLAADPTLGPWPDSEDQSVFQTGAWILPDERPLSPELEAFLEAGDPPIYIGFGSMRIPQEASRAAIQAARALGRRAIVLRGWADLSLMDNEPDCFSTGEVNQQALFRRVAAVVHHGGAGTTTAAALAGAPQVVIPQSFDQHYWAQRIQDLGIGAAHPPGTPTAGSLATALTHALDSGIAARARAIAAVVRTDGATIAAQSLISSRDRALR